MRASKTLNRVAVAIACIWFQPEGLRALPEALRAIPEGLRKIPEGLKNVPGTCLVFNHLPKSGGSTIKSALRRAAVLAGKETPALCIERNFGKEDRCMHAVYHAEVIVGYSELIRAPLEQAQRECQWFTMLRHPIDRLISLFFYCNNPDTDGKRDTRHCGLDPSAEPMQDRLVDFAKTVWGNNAVHHMLMTSSKERPRSEGNKFSDIVNSLQTPHDWELLRKIQDLLNTYDAIGIAEHWTLSMQLFDKTLKSDVKKWVDAPHKNASKASQDVKTKLLEWAMSSPDIHYILAADLLFYDYGLALFRMQTAKALGTVWT